MAIAVGSKFVWWGSGRTREGGITYGAVMESSFLLRMGSDMLTDWCRQYVRKGVVERERWLLVSPLQNVRRFQSVGVGKRHCTSFLPPHVTRLGLAGAA